MSEPVDHDPHRSALFTDLYELTMARAYWAEGMKGRAVFELFFRILPEHRNYVLASGLDDALSFLESFRFTSEDLDYLRGLGELNDDFLEALASVRFTGDVKAVKEGTVVFPHEPLLQVEAPVLEAQIVETYLLNQIHLQSVVATKAARVVTAADGRPVVDFGSRRAHGTDAAIKVARASYLAGAAGTSNLHAGRLFGIPVFGTMAHSYVQAHDEEEQALERFAELFPGTTLLVDTYDTLEGARRVVDLARRMGNRFDVSAVRLDSGDLAELSRGVRRVLDEGGLGNVKIFASSGLDEESIAALLGRGAPIDGFGVGTALAVSRDAPDLDLAYKLVEYGGSPRLKLSEDKVILPGAKQVFRRFEEGLMAADVIARPDERLEGEPLLVPVMRGGRRLEESRESLETIRGRARNQLDSLPPPIRSHSKAESPYSVEVSESLARERRRLARRPAETG
jgi:nicotinate phosphoribosyltransferase